MTSRFGASWERATSEEHLGGLPVKTFMGASKLIRDLPTAAIGAITGEQATLRPRRHMLDGTVTSVRNTLRAAVELRPLAMIGNALNVLDEGLNDATDALTGKQTYIIDTTRSSSQKAMHSIQP